jgi:transposase-like protein
MSPPLSNDLRKRVVAAVLDGESCRSVATRFGVAVSSVVKWSQRWRRTGSVAPGQAGGHRKPVLEPHRAFILERIDQTPHLTLHELKDELAARGSMSRTMWCGCSYGARDYGSKKDSRRIDTVPRCGADVPKAAFLVAWRDPTHEEHSQMRRWVGRAFEPEKFNIDKTNKADRGAIIESW